MQFPRRFILAVLLAVATTTTVAAAPETARIARDKATAVRVLEERLSSGRIDLDAELFAPDVVVHVGTRTATLADDQAAVGGWKAAIPDLAVSVDDVVAEGDRVVVRWTARGTNTGTGNGLPATGKTLQVGGVSMFRMRDGLIAEAWGMFDTFGLFRQLGLIGNPLAQQQ